VKVTISGAAAYIALLAVLVTTGCALVSAGASHITTPVRRAFVSEKEAFESLDRYFDAADEVVALYDDETCHANCLASYFESMLYILPGYPKPEIVDDRCMNTLRRFARAASEAFGGAFSPCLGGNPWYGDVFEWVMQKGSDDTRPDEASRMRQVDEEAVRRLQGIMTNHPANPMVPIAIHAFSYERATCCREVTTFHDWWATVDTHVPPAGLKSDSWKMFQLGYELLRRFGVSSDAGGDTAAMSWRQSRVDESVSCATIETLPQGRVEDYRIADDCALVINGISSVGREIRKRCKTSDPAVAGH